MNPGDELSLRLTGMAFGGEAIGRADDGRLVFVGFALPGERVRVELVEVRARWARARLLEVLEPSPDRTEPRCRHFGRCGGCHYQHAAYDSQLRHKNDIVIDQLRRIGGLQDAPVGPIVGSPDPWGYRNRLRFHLLPDNRLGFYDTTQQALFAVEECHLPGQIVGQLWPQLDFETAGGVVDVEVRQDSLGNAMVVLLGQGGPDFHLDSDIGASVSWHEDDGTLVLAGDPDLTMEIGSRSFRVSPGSFFQTNLPLTELLVNKLLDLLPVGAGDHVFDLYAGVGLFSAFLAGRGARVTAVEASPSACADFEVNLESFDQVTLYEATVEQTLPALVEAPAAVVLDPPRAGLAVETIDALVGWRTPHLAYVSCDPATLARDAKRLTAGGYELVELTPFDMFPQTYHIESLSHFVWRGAPAG